MIKIKYKFLAFVMFILVISYSTCSFAQNKITIAFQIPLEHHLAKNVLFFKQELEANSNNSVSVIINDYGSYIRGRKELEDENSEHQYFMEKNMLEAIQAGKINIGMISLSRLSKLIPLADIFSQPFLIDNENKLADVVAKDSVVRRSIEKSLKKLGINTLWWQPYGSVVFVSKGISAHNPEQIKDKKVRVFGETLGNVVLASGGIPLAIPNSRQYFAYKHQKVDIGMTTIVDIKDKRIWEVMDTISLTNSANMQFLMIANNRWWNALSPHLRALISKTSIMAEEKSMEELKIIEANSFKEAIENGMKIVLLSSDDRDYWREKSSPVYKVFLERTGADGQIAFDSIAGY